MTLSPEEVREKNRLRLRQLRKDQPEWNNAKNQRWKAANMAKYRAHKRVEAAIRFGKMTSQPCQRCGATELVHAHHDDYAQPLNVLWLCPIHHRERHRELENNKMNETISPGSITLHDGPTPYPSLEPNIVVAPSPSMIGHATSALAPEFVHEPAPVRPNAGIRAPVRRAYFIADENRIEFRQGDAVVDTIDLADMTDDGARRACIEGVCLAYLRGASKAGIMTGAAFPDRSPPASASRKAPGLWEQAIAAVRVKEWHAAERAAGRKPDRMARDLFHGEALNWVGTLPKDQIAKAKTSAAVIAEYGNLKGVQTSLDELLAFPPATEF